MKPSIWLAALLLSTPTAAQGQDREPPFRDADLQAMVDKAVPLIEDICARKFERRPKARIGEIRQLYKLMRGEFRAIYTKLYPDLDDKAREQLVEIEASTVAFSLFGKWIFAESTLYVLPATLESMLALDKDAKVSVRGMLQIVVAHELVHALQAQELSLFDRFLACRDADQLDAFHACVEGHAKFVDDQVAKRLGLSAEREYWRTLLAYEKFRDKVPLRELLQRSTRELNAFRYLTGSRFVERIWKQGGAEGIWALLRDPPKHTAAIFHPDRSSDESKPKVDLSGVLDGLDDHFGGGRWRTLDHTLGEARLRSEVMWVEAEDRDPVLSDLVAARELEASRAAITLKGRIKLCVFENEAAAKRFLELAKSSALHERANLPKLPGQKWHEFELDDEPDPAADESYVHRLAVKPTILPSVHRMTIHWRRWGRVVVQVELINLKESKADVAKMLAELRKRLVDKKLVQNA